MDTHEETIAPGERVATADQRVVMYGVPWEHYEVYLALKGEKRAPVMAYLEGTLELMSPSTHHERIRSLIGRLIEVYALERGIVFTPYGSWTLKHAPKEAGVEPDECYIVGADQQKDRPDLAIEVVWTSGGLDKLEIYARLKIAEVWFWKDRQITIHSLREGTYVRVARSAFFPDLDVALVCSLLDEPSAYHAIMTMRAALRR